MSDPDDDWAAASVDFPWPTAGQHPFRPGPHWLSDAKVADDVGERIYRMPEGYKRAADLLVQRALNNRAHRDFLVYPIIFCYRHYLEVQIKCHLHAYGGLVGIAANWEHHAFERLWPSYHELLRRTGDRDDEAVQVVADCVAAFSEIDPGSFSFRYPTGKRGQFLDTTIAHLDLKNLYDVMGSVSMFFLGVEGSLDARADLATHGDVDE
jgi:hypothetical protein